MSIQKDNDKKDTFKKIAGISDLIHTPVRLAILVFLLTIPKATFSEIKQVLNVTSGNLSSHIKRLEKAEYVYIVKKFIDAKPTTEVSISPQGLKAIDEYKKLLKNLLN